MRRGLRFDLSQVKMSKPFVSVLIDTYNHERFIEQAITSVLAQDYPAAQREILVVDDGSTDGTPEVLRKFEGQVRILRKANGGQASAFNFGIPECRGDIIAFLDGDDWWGPTKLSRVVAHMSTDAKIAITGHAIKESFLDGTENIVAPAKDERLTLNSVAAARVFRLRKSFLGTSRMTIRLEIARQILPVPEDIVIQADEYLFTMAAALGDLLILQEPLTHYRIHGSNLYFNAGASEAGLRRKQESLAALVNSLRSRLPLIGAPSDVIACTLEIVQAEADQVRLTLDGGYPWETVQTERTIFEVMHGKTSLPHRLFRIVTIAAAGILPPRWFYAGRRWLGQRSWYRKARQEALPIPEIRTVASPDEFKA